MANESRVMPRFATAAFQRDDALMGRCDKGDKVRRATFRPAFGANHPCNVATSKLCGAQSFAGTLESWPK
jgi:hypothetical protein